MPTSRLSKDETLRTFRSYARLASKWTPPECEQVEAKFEYTPWQEPEEM